mgnify:CR=1 FL=1
MPLAHSIALFILLAPLALAQLSTGRVTGTVRDSTGAVVPGATILLIQVETNVERRTSTNETGAYAFVNLPPGTYRVTANKAGFARASIDSFTVVVNQSVILDVSLSVGQTAESVTVAAEGIELQAATAELGTAIEQRQVDNLPLNGRNFSQLLTLTPGVSPVNVGQNRGGPPRSVGTVVLPSINVHPGRSNLFLLDGILNFGSNQNYFIVTPIADTIQEFKVQSHNDLAEFGGAVGGVVNVVTRSGTNQLHGSAWEYLRNSALDARQYFQPSIPPFAGTSMESPPQARCCSRGSTTDGTAPSSRSPGRGTGFAVPHRISTVCQPPRICAAIWLTRRVRSITLSRRGPIRVRPTGFCASHSHATKSRHR